MYITPAYLRQARLCRTRDKYSYCEGVASMRRWLSPPSMHVSGAGTVHDLGFLAANNSDSQSGRV